MGKSSQRSTKVPRGTVPRAEIPSGAEWEAHCRRLAEKRRALSPPLPRLRGSVKPLQLELPFE
jgi:hypothetical protein